MYKKRVENQVADALSKVQGPTLFAISLSTLDGTMWERIKRSWQSDEVIQEKKRRLTKGEIVVDCKWNGEIFLKGKKVIVGNDIQLQEDIIKLCHTPSMGRHSGLHATTQRIRGMSIMKLE
ncbi:hypothetical protein HanRHA438_Chr06g0277001 [Helianthus annuus]|nr:hypothetical protein HanRHA438_Chr06g0277001 [Helianthus annuus]